MPTSARFLFAEVIRDPVESERHPTALGLPFGKRCRSCSPQMGGVQGWLGRGLPGALSKIADKRKRRVGVRVPWETSGPASILPCLISVIIGLYKNNAGRMVFA